jgi:hypothetical protein
MNIPQPQGDQVMDTPTNPSLLQRALLLDAALSGATGALLALGAGPFSSLLGLPVPLLRWVGIGLLPYAAFLVFLTKRKPISRPGSWVVVVGNVLWAVASVLLLVSGWVEPTTLGYTFTIGQALMVLVFADLQFMGLRRAQPAYA